MNPSNQNNGSPGLRSPAQVMSGERLAVVQSTNSIFEVGPLFNDSVVEIRVRQDPRRQNFAAIAQRRTSHRR